MIFVVSIGLFITFFYGIENWGLLGDMPSIKQLENPCRAPLNAETNQTRLTIEGQESVIRIMAGNMRSRLDMVQHKLVSCLKTLLILWRYQCSEMLA